jgi:polysaccharide pyruvyl transferase WcaK-like protein
MSSARRALLFSVRPNTTNVGNDLIALGTELLVRRAWDGPVDLVSLPAAGDGRGAKTAGLNARNVYEANQLADAMLVGGGNVLENGALAVDPTALRALQIPMALLAISSGRVRGRDGELHPRTDAEPPAAVAALCRRSLPPLVRDDATAELLRELGIEDVVVAGCPSLLLGQLGDELPEPDPSLDGAALVSLRHPKLMSIPYADQARVHRQVEQLIGTLSAGYERAVLVCHDFQDLAFAEAFADVAEVRYTEDARELLAWLRGAAVTVGYRLHGFLACVALGVEALHLSYDERGTAMIATLGLGDYDVALHTTADVAGTVHERLAGLAGVPPRVAAAAVLERLEAAQMAGMRALHAQAAAHRALREERAFGAALPEALAR